MPARSDSSSSGESPKHTRARAAAEVGDAQALGRDRDVVVALVGEDLQLGLVVGGQRAVAVEVVAVEVEQDGGLGRERQRVLELEGRGLADDDGVGGRVAREAERGVGRTDVADDRDRDAGLAMQVPEQLDGRRLAVGAGDRDDLVGDAAPGELQLAEDGDARARGRRR